MADAGSSNIKKTSVVAAAGTMISRVLGLVRDTAIGHVFGASRAADVFWIAFTIPNIFRRFLADEGLTGVLIPGVANAEKEEGLEEARRLAGAGLAALLLFGFGLCLFGIVLAPLVVKAFAYGFSSDPEKFALTVKLTRWLIPFVLFVSLVSYCEGLLNRRNHFFIPKVAPGVVSACIAASAILLAGRFQEPLFALVAGTLVGGLLHLLVCLPPLFRLWGVALPLFREMHGPRFRAFLREMGKIIAIGVLAQINIMVLRQVASFLPEGSVTHYWYANRVVDFAQGTVAVAVGSALLPVIAADVADRNWEKFRAHFGDAVRLIALVLLPLACLLFVLALPIVAVLFQHGAFDAQAADKAAATLQMMVPFMLAVAGINVVKRVYHALDERTTLFWVGLIGVILTALLGYSLAMRIGVEGLGLGLSISTTVQLVFYLALLRGRMGGLYGFSGLGRPLGKMALASMPAGAVAYGISLLGVWSEGSANLWNWIVLALAVGVSLALYGGLAWVMGLSEVRQIVNRFRRL